MGIIWVDGWNHKNCNFALWAFWHVFVVFVSVCLLPLLTFFILSKYFVSFRLIITDWVFLASILFAHDRTCSLVTSLLSSVLVSSLIISTSMSLLFDWCINCSFNCLSTSVQLQSAADNPKSTYLFSVFIQLLD